MIGYIIAGALGLLVLKKARRISGIGAVRYKRVLLKEIAELQKEGVRTWEKWDKLWDEEKQAVRDYAKEVGYKQTNKAYSSGKDIGEQFYKPLYSEYRRLAVSGIGSYQPVTSTHTIVNENGDVLAKFNYYSKEQDLADAKEYWVELYGGLRDTEDAKNITYLAMLNGQKFVWDDIKRGGTVYKGVRAELFGEKYDNKGKTRAEGERKRRISILATKAKGGLTPEAFAHQLWEEQGGTVDIYYLKQGVLEALRNFPGKETIELLLLDTYYSHLEEEHYYSNTQDDYEMPF